MTTVEQAPHRGPAIGESSQGLAVGGGILAGLATLGIIVAVLLALGGDETAETDGRPEPGQPVEPASLTVGDCVDPGSTATASIILRSCETPHPEQVTGRLPFPSADETYPGADQLDLWVGQQCIGLADDYLGAPLLSTTLATDRILPDFDDWAAGDTNITCTVSRPDGLPLDASIRGRAADFPRGEQIPVSRLLVGDCFVPAGGVDSYQLNSNSRVDLVDCQGDHNGVFFGRATLDTTTVGADFPGDVEIGQLTSERCGELFEESFGVSADGFNYRYWRPNQQSWNLGDRNILCAVLDADLLSGTFDPADYVPFFNLDTGDCFDLGPEETARSLGLDDQVITIACEQGHAGQMIGSGQLLTEPDTPYPGEDQVEQLAGLECERLFEEFVGISPFESELVNFPFWYPNDSGWEQGDRRFACAFVEDVEQVGSLEGAEL